MQQTAKIGTQSLLFGTFATRKFCWLQGITNDNAHILAAFGGDNLNSAKYNMIAAGVESQYAADKTPFDLDESDISALVDKFDALDEDKRYAIVNAFIGSVVNKPADEVPKFLKDLEKAAQQAIVDAEKAAPAGKPKAQPKPKTPTAGTSSNESPTATV